MYKQPTVLTVQPGQEVPFPVRTLLWDNSNSFDVHATTFTSPKSAVYTVAAHITYKHTLEDVGQSANIKVFSLHVNGDENMLHATGRIAVAHSLRLTIHLAVPLYLEEGERVQIRTGVSCVMIMSDWPSENWVSVIEQ